jgi:hypothetical protein
MLEYKKPLLRNARRVFLFMKEAIVLAMEYGVWSMEDGVWSMEFVRSSKICANMPDSFPSSRIRPGARPRVLMYKVYCLWF